MQPDELYVCIRFLKVQFENGRLYPTVQLPQKLSIDDPGNDSIQAVSVEPVPCVMIEYTFTTVISIDSHES
jgi:hypothetical protein